MDFYYIMTNYQLLECILHRMCFNNSDNKKVLYLSSYLANNQPKLVESLRKSKIFDGVECYEETFFSHEHGINIAQEIDRISNDVEQKYGKIINDADNLYIGQDFDALGVYLVHKKIKYSYFEDGCGTYTNEEVLCNIIKKENENRFEIIKKLKLIGKSKYAERVFCDFEHQKKEKIDAKCIDFSIKKILEEMKPKEIDTLLQVYGFNRKNQKRKGSKDLLLTWHYSNMKMLTLDEQYLFFSLLTDYFHDDNSTLYVKPHPSDIQPDYKKIFKNAVILEGLMPSELLPYCISDVFENAITNWSTSVFGLKNIIHNIINFDKRIDETYIDFDKYYAIVLLLDKIKSKEKVTLICENINEIQLLRLLDKYFSNYQNYYTFSDKENPNMDTIYIVKERLKEDNKKVIELKETFNAPNYIQITKEYKEKGKNEEYIGIYNFERVYIEGEKDLKYSGYKIVITIKSISEVTRFLCEEKRNYKLKYENELQDKKKQIEMMQNEIASLQGKIDGLQSETAMYSETIKDLYNSTSWKVTKPLRRTGDFIRNIKKK